MMPGPLTDVSDGHEVHQGVELIATGSITTGLHILGGVTLLDAKVVQARSVVDDNRHPANMAGQMAKATLEYDLPLLRSATLTGGLCLVGTRAADGINSGRIAPYVAEDVGVRCRTKLPIGQEDDFSAERDESAQRRLLTEQLLCWCASNGGVLSAEVLVNCWYVRGQGDLVTIVRDLRQ